jgi:hypothetical protein
MGTCTAVKRDTARTLMATRVSCQNNKLRIRLGAFELRMRINPI